MMHNINNARVKQSTSGKDVLHSGKDDKTTLVDDEESIIIKVGELRRLTQILMDAVESIGSLKKKKRKKRIHLM